MEITKAYLEKTIKKAVSGLASKDDLKNMLRIKPQPTTPCTSHPPL